jgi:hypothetical protein
VCLRFIPRGYRLSARGLVKAGQRTRFPARWLTITRDKHASPMQMVRRWRSCEPTSVAAARACSDILSRLFPGGRTGRRATLLLCCY